MALENPPPAALRRTPLARLSSPEQLDQLMEVTRLRSWLALAGIGVLLATVLAWSIFGTVSTTIPAEGMLIRPGGLSEIYAPEAGTIGAINVAEGDLITKGQPVATLDQPELSAQIAQLESELAQRRSRLPDSPGAQRPAPAARVGSRALLEPDEAQAVQTAEQTLQGLHERLKASSVITSPYSGRILEIKVRPGELVSRGSRLLSFQLADNEAKGLQAVVFVSSNNGKNIAQGMPVQISPSTAAPEEYGYLLGTITYVSEFPATREGMMRVLANEELVASLSRAGPPFTAYADLSVDASWQGGYRWTSRKGASVRVNTGTPCEAFIQVRTQRPIELVLPFVRQLAGL
jgi:biotin carboxyl carrier protein